MQEAVLRQQGVASTSSSLPASGRAWRSPLAAGSRRGHSHQCRVGPPQRFDLWQSAELPPEYKPAYVVPGTRTLATPRLDPQRVFQRMLQSPHPHALRHFAAFYSTTLGGVTTEPGLMAVPADDRLVHRSHAVRDAVPLVGGALYRLQAHVDRLLAAAAAVGVEAPMSEPALKRVLLDVAAASRKVNGHVLVWLSAGRGGFGPTPSADPEHGGSVGTALYALVTTEFASDDDTGVDRTVGWRGAVSPVPPPPPYFAVLRTPSMLEAGVAQLEAEGRGADVPLLVDEDGHVAGSPDASLAIVTADGTFVYAPFERAPPGVTVQALAELIPANRSDDDLPVAGVERRAISLDELKGAAEALLASSTHGVVGLTHVDGHPIGDGRPGLVTVALQAVLENDREPRAGSPVHTPVPYGGLTGMESNLL